MDKSSEIMENLVLMSRDLGMPDKDYVILGDGNSSARGQCNLLCEGQRHAHGEHPARLLSRQVIVVIHPREISVTKADAGSQTSCSG